MSHSNKTPCIASKRIARRYHRQRRGAIFIVALGITLVLSAMLLVYVQEMRTESVTAANRLAGAEADAVEQGAEQWVLAQIEANVTPQSGAVSTSSTSTLVDPTTIPAEALQVGKGYFWLLHPDPTQDQLYGFGIVDESGKLNINGATADQLMLLPNMTQDIATNITTWPATASLSGSALNYETVEELLMVDNMTELTPQVLYGYDLNHDGIIDDNERSAANGAAITNGTTLDSRGLFNFITVYSNNAAAGTQGSPVPTARTPKTLGVINVNTASAQVLACLPGMTSASAQTLINQRPVPTTPGDTSWMTSALGQAQAQALAPYISGNSYQYSADIVAVSGNGRAFKRVRIVVDARAQPAAIIYRKDLTSLGFPLPERLRTALQTGKGVPQDLTGTTNKQTSGGF
jgi:DNA uptake protein ComE-like DNA-binding protein